MDSDQGAHITRAGRSGVWPLCKSVRHNVLVLRPCIRLLTIVRLVRYLLLPRHAVSCGRSFLTLIREYETHVESSSENCDGRCRLVGRSRLLAVLGAGAGWARGWRWWPSSGWAGRPWRAGRRWARFWPALSLPCGGLRRDVTRRALQAWSAATSHRPRPLRHAVPGMSKSPAPAGADAARC